MVKLVGIVNSDVGNSVEFTCGLLIVSDAPTCALVATSCSFSCELSNSSIVIVNVSISGDARLTFLPLFLIGFELLLFL